MKKGKREVLKEVIIGPGNGMGVYFTDDDYDPAQFPPKKPEKKEKKISCKHEWLETVCDYCQKSAVWWCSKCGAFKTHHPYDIKARIRYPSGEK